MGQVTQLFLMLMVAIPAFAAAYMFGREAALPSREKRAPKAFGSGTPPTVEPYPEVFEGKHPEFIRFARDHLTASIAEKLDEGDTEVFDNREQAARYFLEKGMIEPRKWMGQEFWSDWKNVAQSRGLPNDGGQVSLNTQEDE